MGHVSMGLWAVVFKWSKDFLPRWYYQNMPGATSGAFKSQCMTFWLWLFIWIQSRLLLSLDFGHLNVLFLQLYPHITHYSKIDCQDAALILRSARPCKAGHQCFLNYGTFPNSHFLMFYGFTLGEENPFDVVPIGVSLIGPIYYFSYDVFVVQKIN